MPTTRTTMHRLPPLHLLRLSDARVELIGTAPDEDELRHRLFGAYRIADLDPDEQPLTFRAMPGADALTQGAYEAELRTMRAWRALCTADAQLLPAATTVLPPLEALEASAAPTAPSAAPFFYRWNEGGAKRRVAVDEVLSWWKAQAATAPSAANALTGGLYSGLQPPAGSGFDVEHVVPMAWMHRTQMLDECTSVDTHQIKSAR